LYTAADFELDERHVIVLKKLHWTDTEFDRTYFLLLEKPISAIDYNVIRYLSFLSVFILSKFLALNSKRPKVFPLVYPYILFAFTFTLNDTE